MNLEIKSKLEAEYLDTIKKIEEWEELHKDTLIFKFYSLILKYKFWNKTNEVTIESLVQTSLYTFLKEVVSFTSDINFIITLQSFLSNITDDFFYKVDHNNGDPVIYIDNDDGGQEFLLLFKALDFIINRETKFFNRLQEIRKRMTNRNVMDMYIIS